MSLIIPFDPQTTAKAVLVTRLNNAVAKITEDLKEQYPDDKWLPAVKRLGHIIKDLNYYTFKKSIAIFMSPLAEKVYYLDIDVDETCSIDDSFNIRDLVYSKRRNQAYLLLVLSSTRTKIYSCTPNSISLTVSNVPRNMDTGGRHAAATGGENTSGNSDDHGFFQYTEHSLDLLLQAQSLPVVVLGSKEAVAEFKKIPASQDHIIEYLSGSFEKFTDKELLALMLPVAKNWDTFKKVQLSRQIEGALKNNMLTTGISHVLHSVAKKGKRLLVMEKKFRMPFGSGAGSMLSALEKGLPENVFYINDVADFIIERVFEAGGDVEFLDDGTLTEYGGMVLIG
jgi:hypothetical protein